MESVLLLNLRGRLEIFLKQLLKTQSAGKSRFLSTFNCIWYFSVIFRNILVSMLKQHFSVEVDPFQQKYISFCQDSTLLFIRHMDSQNHAAF